MSRNHQRLILARRVLPSRSRRPRHRAAEVDRRAGHPRDHQSSLTLIVLLFLPVMAAYAFYFNRRMNAALRVSFAGHWRHQRGGQKTRRSGIWMVKSFTNEAVEMRVRRRKSLFSRQPTTATAEAIFPAHDRLTQLITIA
ncbi:MAG: hypothetical protein U0521_21200 [Anaerolineae bacterium]